jgi:putative addiction module component (TIGR02574 family)
MAMTSPFERVDESSHFPSWHFDAGFRFADSSGRGCPFHSLALTTHERGVSFAYKGPFIEPLMHIAISDLEAQALKLSPEERVLLADRLLSSRSKDQEVEGAWAAESDRRLAELEAVTVEAVPVGDTLARARQAIR